jgi:hypothetical protein
MTLKYFELKSPLALIALATAFCVGTPAFAQVVPAQQSGTVQDADTTRREIESFDQFLDQHLDIARQVREKPSLVNDEQFVNDHPALADYLNQHPAVREKIRENPSAFMQQEGRFERHEDDRNVVRDPDRDTTRGELASFDRFLDQHRDIAQQVREKPSLVNDAQFVKSHPALADYLQSHPTVAEEIRENPTVFMQQETRFDQREDNRGMASDRDRDTTRRELASFDRFLDQHRDIAQQVREKPSLVNDAQFVKSHPALQTYMQSHPTVAEEIRENPTVFMQQETRFDQREDNRGVASDRDRDTTRGELASFDRFLDQHHEIAEQVREKPSLVNDAQFVKNHPALQSYLQSHPTVAEEIKENPNVFMQQESRFDQREDNRGVASDRDRDTTRRELASFDRFLDQHRQIAQQVREKPNLVNDEQFLKSHPELQTYLQSHPTVAEEIRENPTVFMQQETRFDQREDNRNVSRDTDRDTTRGELASFDRFLDQHHEIAEQVREKPSLVNDAQFVKTHPALATYLQSHPTVGEEIKENPSAFMQQEARFDRREDTEFVHVREGDHLQRQFGEFLGGHSGISDELTKDPSLAKNKEFLENHPELRDFLKSHPDVQQELMKNPASFVSSSQKFTGGTKTGTGVTTPSTTATPPVPKTAPPPQPKPNQ